MKAARAFELPGAAPPRLVAAGHVDLFLQRCEDGVAVGARHHLVRLAAGTLLPALLPLARPYGVLAVPAPGAQLVALAPGEAPEGPLSGLLLALCAEGHAAWPPGSSQWIEPGATLDLAPGALLSCSQRLAWLRVEAGMLQVGAQRLEAGALWPLAAADWAQVVEGPARVAALAPGRVPPAPALEALAPWLLDRFDRAWQRIEDRGRQDGERLLRKAAETQAALGDALTRLTRVAAADAPPRPPGAAESADLLQACRLLEPGTGLRFSAPARSPAAAPMERLEAIARSSRLRCRRVVLGGDWWRQDNGPLVGFLDDETPGQPARPVALRPGRGGRMELHDPQNERPWPVDATLARRIAPVAMQFFAALPEGRLSGWDLLRFGARGLGPDFARLLGASALVGLLGAAAPLVTGRLVDEAIPSADKAGVLALGVALLAAALSSLLFGLARAVAQLRIEGRMDGALQAALWDRVLALPAGFFRHFAAGDLALRINGINTLRQGLSGAVVSTLLAGLFSACNLVVLLWLAPGLAGVALGLIVLALAVSFTGGVLKLRSERLRAALAGRISGMVHEYLGGIVKLRLCAAEARAFANWALQYTRLRALMLRSMHVTTLEQTFFGGYAVLVSAALFALVGLQQFDDARAALSPGAFITFNAAFGVAFAGLMDLAMTAMGLLVLVPAYERLRPILDALPESPGGSGDPGEPSGDIEVQQLGFAYAEGGPEVLSDVSFRVRPGEFVAIVGPSGSGKSTLLRLLLGFEQARSGSVCFDGRNLLDLDADALRRQLGVVLQSGQLLSGDVFSNIAGVSGATLEQAWEAARLCGLEDDIQAMPMGMHTVIGEGSSTLSGGQRQRILIARAIVGRPRILFLDEATSALDNRSQRIVAESLARLRATRIVIAHRLSTIVQADRILVLQDGRLVQQGSYAELAAQPGLFAELVQRQQA